MTGLKIGLTIGTLLMDNSSRRARSVRIAALFCVVSAFVQVVAAAGPKTVKAAPNVILITIDTVRADHLGCYGANNIQTPTLDALGHDGVVFERAISQVPLTWPSHAVILTGLYPFQNGVQDFTGQPLDARFRSVAQAFQQHGYATGAVISAFVLDRSFGLARGFDFYDDAFAPEAFVNRDLGLVDRRAGESVDRALSWLKKNSRRPFFFWLHLYDPHSPYDPPEPYRSQYQGHLYDGEIAYADHELGRLIAWLKQSQLYASSLILFVSDHGESLGEHEEQEHGFFVYNATVHVPLIVKLPAGSGIRPGRVTRPVETAAVAATLLEGAKIHDAKIHGAMRQQPQAPGLFEASASSDDAAYSETFYPFSSFGWSPLHALETSRYHYIDAPQPELYDLVADPGEKDNRAAQQTATAAVLKDKLQRLLHDRPYTPKPDSNSGLSTDALDKLRALGYVAYRSPVSSDALASGLPDPKGKLWEFNSILGAADAFHVGDFSKGQKLLGDVQDKDPQMYLVPFMLGESALRQQQWSEAVGHLQRCLELNPNFDQAMVGLAHGLVQQGNLDAAKGWLKKALQFNPQNYRAWYELGSVESRNDKAAAIADYEQGVAIQGNFAPLRRDLGMLYFEQQNYSKAAEQLAKAIKLGLKEAPLFNFLGICYSRTDRLPKAIESYKEALQLNPQLAEAHLNLAYAYQKTKRARSAQEEYELACKWKADYCRFVPETKETTSPQ